MFDNYFVITKHDSQNVPPSTPNSILKRINTNFANYSHHTTRSYRVDSTNYAFTQIYYHKNSSIPYDSQNPLLIKAGRKEGAEDFGSGPSANSGNCRVILVIHRPSIFHLESQRGMEEHEYLVAEPLLVLEDRFFKTGSLRYEPEEILSKIEPVCSSFEICFHTIEYVRLNTTYRMPKYKVEHCNNVVTSEADLTTHFNVDLHLIEADLSSLSCDIMLSNVTIELYELRSRMNVLGEQNFLNSLVRGSRKITLISKDCWEVLQLGKRYRVPKKLYQCSLPALGPTFFSSNMARSYALKVSVTLACTENHIVKQLSQFVNLNVAELDLRRHKCRQISRDAHGGATRILRMLKLPHDQFSPSTVAEQAQKLVNPLGTEAFRMHNLTCRSLSDGVYLRAWAELEGSPDATDSEQDMSTLPDSTEDDSTVCEVSSLHGRLTGVFTTFCGGEPTLRSPPFGNDSNFLHGLSLDSMTRRSHYIDKVKKGCMMWSMSLNVDFVKSSQFEQRESSKIVLPGQMIPNFATLYLTLPSRKLPKSPYKFHVKYLSIEVEEIAIVIGDRVRQLPIKRHPVCKKTCNFVFEKKEAKRKIIGNPHVVAMNIPRNMYNCRFPRLGPTFFTEKYQREYRLRFEIRMQCGEHYESLVVHLPISVARRAIEPGTFAASVARMIWWPWWKQVVVK